MLSKRIVQIANWTSFVLVGLLNALFALVISPFRRGFFCDDDSIKYPFVAKETVPIWAVGVLAFGCPVVVVVICETVRYCCGSRFQTDNRQNACGLTTKHPLFHRLSKITFVFFYGALLNLLLTLFVKACVGRLRPHFLSVCKPDMALINCSEGYITAYDCTGTNDAVTKIARRSFPSGHASTSMYAMLFLALYFEALATKKKATFLKPFMQCGCIMTALFFGLSRISDYMHFWTDVLAGFMLGAITAMYIVFVVLRLFKPSQQTTQQRNFQSSEPLNPLARDYRLASVETEIIQ